MEVVWLLRVISGKARGLKLQSLDGLSTRPTLDRVKESIFNMLFDKVNGASVLDLFAGSGALGIESLSRYATECTFVDNNTKAIEVIRENLTKARFLESSDLIYDDYKSFLEKTDKKFDVVFLDPPYMAGITEDVLELIYKKNILKNGALIIVESDKNNVPCYGDNFKVIKEKYYGRVCVCLLEAIWVTI